MEQVLFLIQHGGIGWMGLILFALVNEDNERLGRRGIAGGFGAHN